MRCGCMTCDHSGTYTGASRFLREPGQVRLVLVCDLCGQERVEIGALSYRPLGRRLVGQPAELTARELGLSEAQTARVRLAAMICDVGRDQIPYEILHKRGPLSPQEWVEIRRQPELGAALLSDASFDDIREWILCRRERPDGSGYPRGLHDEQIPMESRILAVAEAYVAITSDRAHRPARGHEEAMLELLRCAGTQFDMSVVHAFVQGAFQHPPLRATAAA
jgi:HD-GYP domain-containing protein (c-di-GMP phosphodiesterase class II)